MSNTKIHATCRRQKRYLWLKIQYACRHCDEAMLVVQAVKKKKKRQECRLAHNAILNCQYLTDFYECLTPEWSCKDMLIKKMKT